MAEARNLSDQLQAGSHGACCIILVSVGIAEIDQESVANVFVGYGVAVVTQILIFPIFGLHTTLAQNLKMGAIFTVVSIARSFALRRVFEAIRMRSAK